MSDIRLLILDDEVSVGQLLMAIGRSMGAATHFTTDPSEFLRYAETWFPTHVVVDLVMPAMDGVEVMIRLAELQSRARVVISSGVGPRVLDAAARSATEHGLTIAGVLPKPFRPSDLRAMLAVEDSPFAREPGSLRRFSEFKPTRADLEAALRQRQFVLQFQPKVHCATRAIAGFEALVRWQHPEFGVVPPLRFVPFAEETGFIRPLTLEVLRLGVNWFAENLRSESHGFPPSIRAELSLAINISARSLGDSTFLQHACDVCEHAGIEPQRVVFELTETAAMDDPIQSLELLTRLRMKGFRLSIDDFGTGFSSMLQLVRLPFSEIKVDKSFVITAMNSEESRTVIRSIVDLGRSLSLETIAEGVEDPSTLEYLHSIGCDLAQGYYISRPLDANRAVEWSRQHVVGLV